MSVVEGPPVTLTNDQFEDAVEILYRMEECGLPVILEPDFTHLYRLVSVAVAAHLFFQQSIDQVVVLCPKEKTLYWTGEFEDSTILTPLCYHGTRRHQQLAKVQPNVIVSTHETLRSELIDRQKVPGKRGRGKWVEGDLVAQLKLNDSRTLWIFDGVERVQKRSAEHHQAYVALFKQLQGARQRFLVLLNDPPQEDPEAFYNLGRLFVPEAMPTVARFEQEFCIGHTFTLDLIFRPDRMEDFLGLFGKSLLRSRTLPERNT